MQQALSISALAKSAGVTARTLRYWERLGLLPKATRTHTGYRVFDPQTAHYIDFIQRAKAVGLTLKELKLLLELARKGKNPCPQVMRWIEEKAVGVEQQIRTLRALQKRLQEFQRAYSVPAALACCRAGELCCLIEGLPNPGNGGRNAKVVRARNYATRNAGSNRRYTHVDGGPLSALSAVPLGTDAAVLPCGGNSHQHPIRTAPGS